MELPTPTLSPPDEREERLSRRRFLSLSTVVGLGALLTLTACGNGGGDDDDEDDDEDDD